MDKVTALGIDGIKRELIFHQSMMLHGKNDVLTFEISRPEKPFRLNLTIRFSDEGTPLSTSISPSVSGSSKFDLTLHNWYSPSFLAFKQPWMIGRVTNKRVWVQVNSEATEKGIGRYFRLTIWLEA